MLSPIRSDACHLAVLTVCIERLKDFYNGKTVNTHTETHTHTHTHTKKKKKKKKKTGTKAIRNFGIGLLWTVECAVL